MLDGVSILIVEDEAIIAIEIAEAVEQAGGRVIGPVATVREALALVESEPLDAAILDASLRDRNVTPVLTILLARGTPLVLHTGGGVPPEMQAYRKIIPLVGKPAPPEALINSLSSQLASRDPTSVPGPLTFADRITRDID